MLLMKTLFRSKHVNGVPHLSVKQSLSSDHLTLIRRIQYVFYVTLLFIYIFLLYSPIFIFNQ